MKFKLIIALVSDEHTETVIECAREMGATGATVLTNARGEGLNPAKTFFGLTLEGQMDMVLFIVEKHMCRTILEGIGKAGHFDEQSGTGCALQLDIEDVVGLDQQLNVIKHEIEDQI